jgi:hydrogenase maturation factor
LIGIEEGKTDVLISRLREKGIEHAAIIGKVVSKSGGKILLKKKNI